MIGNSWLAEAHNQEWLYGTIRAELERNGQMIGNNDLWIAAHAKAAELTLVSNNEREFRRVRGLKVRNWSV